MAETIETLRKELPEGAFWVTGKWMRRLIDGLISDRARLAHGSGQEVPTDSGRFFVIEPGSSAAAAPAHPFRVTAAGMDGSGDPQVIVEIDSWLMGSPKWNDKITITGLGAAFVIGLDEGIWLEATFDTEEEGSPITGVTVEHGPLWEEYPEPVALTGSGETLRQSKGFCLIAFTQAPSDDYPDRVKLTPEGEDEATMEIVQCVTTHLRLCRECYDGNDVRIFGTGHAPGPAV